MKGHVRIFLVDLPVVWLQLYRLLRKHGWSRYDANLIVYGGLLASAVKKYAGEGISPVSAAALRVLGQQP